MKTVLMLATTAAMIEQFNKNNILILEEMGYEVHVAGNFLEGNPISDKRLEEFKLWIEEHHGKWFHIPATRKPTDLKNNIAAYKDVLQLIREYHYDFIHCHTPIGSVIGRLAAHETHTRIIYTAHGFHFFKGAPFINWILYYPVERFLSRWTDVLILINQEDYNRAKKDFHAKRTEYLAGVGVDVNSFKRSDVELKGRDLKRKELGIKNNEIMILSVGELIERKNHKVAIEAIEKLDFDNVKYVICGKGMLEKAYRDKIRELQIESEVILLGFREDIPELCNAADIYLFPSKQEGLSLALMEAMAAGLPVVASDIRGNSDLIDNNGGYLIMEDNASSYAEALKKLVVDSAKRLAMGSYNSSRIVDYDIKAIDKKMRYLYMNFME